MFEVVHEIAVVGTTVFMMAVGSLWYSTLLFGKMWQEATGVVNDTVAKTEMRNRLILTFVSYGLVVLLMAFMIPYITMLQFPVWKFSLVLWLVHASLLASQVVWENRSFSYLLITSGFSAILLGVGAQMLVFWPW